MLKSVISNQVILTGEDGKYYLDTYGDFVIFAAKGVLVVPGKGARCFDITSVPIDRSTCLMYWPIFDRLAEKAMIEAGIPNGPEQHSFCKLTITLQ